MLQVRPQVKSATGTQPGTREKDKAEAPWLFTNKFWAHLSPSLKLSWEGHTGTKGGFQKRARRNEEGRGGKPLGSPQPREKERRGLSLCAPSGGCGLLSALRGLEGTRRSSQSSSHHVDSSPSREGLTSGSLLHPHWVHQSCLLLRECGGRFQIPGFQEYPES